MVLLEQDLGPKERMVHECEKGRERREATHVLCTALHQSTFAAFCDLP